MARHIRQDDGQPAVGRVREVIKVATRLLGRTDPPRDVVSLQHRRAAGEQAELDLAGDLQFALEPLLLYELLEQELPLQGHAGLGAEGPGQDLVIGVEGAAAPVEDLEDAQHGVVVSPQRASK